LPKNIIPNITPLTSSASSVLGIGITSKIKNLTELRSIAENIIIPHLMSVPGVADVNRFGGLVKQIQIEVIPDKLFYYNVTISDIVKAAEKSTGVIGAGFIENKNQRIIINTEGQSKTIEELELTALVNGQGKTITIKDVANVIIGSSPSISAASINGKEGVYLSVQGQLNSDTYKLTKQIEVALENLKAVLLKEQVILIPDLFKPANFIDASIKGLRIDLLIGALMVISILFLFLFNLKTAFISAIAIPLSLLSAIIVMSYFNLGLNVMVLSGLAIALGEVVDDAIIDVENIFRRLKQNRKLAKPKPIYNVVFEASMEVRRSVIFATVIIVLVFLPLLSLTGVAGKLFGPLGIAYIASIIASLFVAMTITPALCYLLLGKSDLQTNDSPVISYLKKKYIKILNNVEKRSRSIIFTSLLVISIGLASLPFFKTQFIPPLHEGHFIMHMTAFPGTSESESIRIGNEVSEKILSIQGVKSVAQWVGRSPLGADTFGTHYSEFEIELDNLNGSEQDNVLKEIRRLVQDQNEDKIINTGGFVGVNFAINTFLTERIEETISGYNASVVINVFGDNLNTLDQDAQKIVYALRGLDGASDIMLQSPPGTPQVSIRLHSEKMSQYGILKADVLNIIKTAYEGFPAAIIYDGIIPVEIAVTLDKSYRDDILDIKELPIRTANNKIISLDQIAFISQENGHSKILHQDGKRVQTITLNIEGKGLNEFTKLLNKKISKIKLSPSNYFEITGSAEENAKSRESLIVHSILVGFVVLLLLYIAFGSLLNLGLTLINLPFALIGGVIAVIFSGGWISIGSLVGFVTLFGITLRNSIMLLSHYQFLVNKENCLWNLETCIRGATERLPSILMTALVAGLALLPIALGSNQPGKEIEAPMAAIIIGGLFTSTILNLLILPTILLNFGSFKKEMD
jgi:CzcA family heavy metal efflux pump